ncbi:MAG TPA: His/Gly/Thr/Pro-type tRNA ligase C-terminal domain-containing protein, partial [Gemmatimonadaceae bacterium]
SKMKVPYMAIIGKREAEAGMVALRFRGSEKKQETISVDALIERLTAEIATRALQPAGALQPLEAGL